jgi:hypothetical protein
MLCILSSCSAPQSAVSALDFLARVFTDEQRCLTLQVLGGFFCRALLC